MIRTRAEARTLLLELRAPERLIRHGELVLEAAEALIVEMRRLTIAIDEPLVRAGAMLHDAGKSLHPNELNGAGAQHEEAGRALLLENGVDAAVARCCVSHAQWEHMEGGASLEELLVALADALWKGVRRERIEQRVVEEVAARTNAPDRWSVFIALDTCFEAIAAGGLERLSRS